MNKNLAVLKSVTAGTPLMDALTVARINAIQDAIKQLWSGENLRSGGNMQIVPSANGPTINSLALGGDNISNIIGGGNTAFDVDVTASGFGYRLDVHPGTVNGLLPTNYNLSHTTASTSDVVYLVLNCTVANGAVSAATLAFAADPADPVGSQLAAPPGAFAWTLGLLIAGKWYKLVAGSLMATPQELFRVAKLSFSPGELPYDAYYTWAVAYV